MITRLVAASALALTVFVAQPAAVSAKQITPAASGDAAGVALTMAWAVGVFVCTGMTWGKMQVDAQKHHRQLTGADAFRGIGRCLLPTYGFAQLMQGK